MAFKYKNNLGINQKSHKISNKLLFNNIYYNLAGNYFIRPYFLILIYKLFLIIINDY
jgi:hypothetical protein